jgi:hypothetical protein
MLNFDRIAQHTMAAEPFQWAFIDGLFSVEDGASLASSFPRDKFKTVAGYDGEKSYEYMSRSLVHMGAAEPSFAEGLSPAWRALAEDLLSPEYRSVLMRISGQDLQSAQMEVNVIHYGPGAWLGPHVDLKEKMMTHVLYFNEAWDAQQGGNLRILGSSDSADVLAEIPQLPNLPQKPERHLSSPWVGEHNVAAWRNARSQGLYFNRLTVDGDSDLVCVRIVDSVDPAVRPVPA